MPTAQRCLISGRADIKRPSSRAELLASVPSTAMGPQHARPPARVVFVAAALFPPSACVALPAANRRALSSLAAVISAKASSSNDHRDIKARGQPILVLYRLHCSNTCDLDGGQNHEVM